MVLAAQQPIQDVRSRVVNSALVNVDRGIHHLTFGAMSTKCRVLIHGVPEKQAREFQQQALHWVADFEAKYSRFLPDSLVSRINQAAGEHWVDVDPEAERLFSLCDTAVFLTRGAFDPTALPLIKLWNWKVPNPVLPNHEAIESSRQLVGWTRVQRRPGAIFLPQPGMALDFGGIGKEFAVDRVAEMATQRGISHVLVDFGHDVRACGSAPGKDCWSVGLEDPTKPGTCWVGLAVRNMAVATSGDYVRHSLINGRRYGHIIDPRTGYPVDNGCRAVSVVASSCTMAGLLSTTAFILGPKDGLQLIETQPRSEGAVSTESQRGYTRRFYEHAITS